MMVRTHRCRSRGLTLLEVMLALSIFALVMVGVLTTFRTASRSYRRSENLLAGLQTVRSVTDLLRRDVRAVFLVNETTYGVPLAAGEEDNTDLGVTAPLAGAPPTSGDGSVINSLVEYDALVTEEDYRDPSLEAGLSFTVREGGESDSVTFVRRLRSMNTRRAQPWGLARVTYELEGDQLVRRSEPIYRRVEDVIPYEGESLAEAEARVEEELALLEEEDAKTEPLADGVEIFDIRCVHWADDSWVVSDDWDSRDKSKRNSMTSTTIVDGDPNYPLYLAQMERVPEDGLPSALEIVLGIRDPLSGRLRNSRLVVPLAAAQETWTPLDDRLVDSTGINRTRGRGITP